LHDCSRHAFCSRASDGLLRLRHAGGISNADFLIFDAGYRAKRITAFLHPYSDPLGAGFQILQSYIAVGTGGIAGMGLMEGKEKLFSCLNHRTTSSLL